MPGDGDRAGDSEREPCPVRLRVRYTGRVQGVGFRATARAVSRRHRASGQVTGWVRNEADGTVLLEVQGEAGAARAYLDDLGLVMERNIERADVDGIAVVDGETGFEIRA